MGIQYLNSDGGHLPPGAAPDTASNLLADYAARPAAERAAFRQAICPRHFTVTAAADVALLADAWPGDTAGVAGSVNHLYLLKAMNPSLTNSWVDMLTNLPPPALP